MTAGTLWRTERTPRVNMIANRFRDAPDDLPVEPMPYLHHWHLGSDHPAPDVVPLGGIPHEKNRGYPPHRETIAGRAPGAAAGSPVALEMEIGRQASQLEGVGIPAKVEALAHVGRAVDELAAVGVAVDHWYGCGWLPISLPGAGVLNDLAVWALTGRLPRLAVTLYGRFSHAWATERRGAITRASWLRHETAGACVPVCYFGPGWGRDRMTVAEYRNVCAAGVAVCDHANLDAMHWDDAGNPAASWSEAEPYAQAFAEAFRGFEGVNG